MKHDINILLNHFSYNAETGDLFWKISKSGRKLNKKVGHLDNEGYLRVIFDGVRYRVHRLVYMIETKNIIPNNLQIDHINGNRSDNSFKNLRLVTSRENNLNRITHRTGKLVGASFHKVSGKWVSVIRINKKRNYLGYFATNIEAHEAYIRAMKAMV